MRVLMVHNAYRYAGGEEQAVADDRSMLAARGHETRLLLKTYDELSSKYRTGDPRLALEAIWSLNSYAEIRGVIRDWRPDLVHFHNIFPLVSPSAYAACRAEGVPVVQTLHNYRLVCPAGTLLREGKVCELCVGRTPVAAVRYACYRGSHAQSFALSAILSVHRALGTWSKSVTAYIALTEFGRRVFLRGGLPPDRVFVRPNTVADVEPAGYAGPASAVFVGRLSPEKGLAVLLDAWRDLDLPLTIVGDGPLAELVRARVAALGSRRIEIAGRVPHDEVLRRIHGSGMLVFPSLWYEGLPLVILEALAAGVPVIGSALGAVAESIRHGVSGLLFPPGDAAALRRAVAELRQSPELARRLSAGARREYEERFSPERSYDALMRVYRYVTGRA